MVKATYTQYEQFVLSKNFRQYLETILFSAKVLRMDIQKTPYLKMHELQTDKQDFTVDFLVTNRQFDWIEISLVYDKSEKHLTIYDSYNAECATKIIKAIEFSNVSEEHSARNTKRFDTSSDLQKYFLYKQFIAWHTNGCSIAPIMDYINNPIAQELADKEEYFGDS